MTRTGWVIGAAALALLAGCSKSEEKADVGTMIKPATATEPATLGAPKRKSGLWEQKVAMATFENVSQMCVDQASEKEMAAFGQQMNQESKCSEQHFSRRLDGSLEFTSVCPAGQGATMSTKGVIKGDFNSSYTMTATTVTTGSSMPQANGEHQMTMTATWKGPCPPEMKPGDIRIAGMPGRPAGATFNPTDMAKAGKAPSPEQLAELRKQAEAMKKQMGQ